MRLDPSVTPTLLSTSISFPKRNSESSQPSRWACATTNTFPSSWSQRSATSKEDKPSKPSKNYSKTSSSSISATNVPIESPRRRLQTDLPRLWLPSTPHFHEKRTRQRSRRQNRSRQRVRYLQMQRSRRQLHRPEVYQTRKSLFQKRKKEQRVHPKQNQLQLALSLKIELSPRVPLHATASQEQISSSNSNRHQPPRNPDVPGRRGYFLQDNPHNFPKINKDPVRNLHREPGKLRQTRSHSWRLQLIQLDGERQR